jgi:hypothetical protein
MTQTRITQNGFERESLSPFGQLGSLVVHFSGGFAE